MTSEPDAVQIAQEWIDSHPDWRPGIGLGQGPEDACSIAFLNLALTGQLTDAIPDCMSEVIGQWIIRIQDAMPADIRNSQEWRDLLPLAAGTGREREQVRLDMILDWMWGTALPLVQPVADEHGFGDEWREMCEQRTTKATRSARAAAADAATAASDAATAASASDAAYAASYDAVTAIAAARSARAAAADAATAASDAATAASDAAYAATYATCAVDAAADAARAADAWRILDPVGLLRRLITLGDDQ